MFKTRTSFQGGGGSDIAARIMFTEQQRQPAAHYLHSAPVSGLLSAGISLSVY